MDNMININALPQVETPPPCETHGGCKHYKTCKAEELACRPFVTYVARGGDPKGSRNPTKEHYNMVFNHEALQDMRSIALDQRRSDYS